jgi:hypothetical protein
LAATQRLDDSIRQHVVPVNERFRVVIHDFASGVAAFRAAIAGVAATNGGGLAATGTAADDLPGRFASNGDTVEDEVAAGTGRLKPR